MESIAYGHITSFTELALWSLRLCSYMPRSSRLAVAESKKYFSSQTTASKYLPVRYNITSFRAFDISDEDVMLRKVFGLEEE